MSSYNYDYKTNCKIHWDFKYSFYHVLNICISYVDATDFYKKKRFDFYGGLFLLVFRKLGCNCGYIVIYNVDV